MAMVLQQDSHRPSAAQPDPPLTLMDSETNVQAESEGLYKYLTQFHLALGFVMTKYAPDPQVTFDHRLSHPACLAGPEITASHCPSRLRLQGSIGMQSQSANHQALTQLRYSMTIRTLEPRAFLISWLCCQLCSCGVEHDTGEAIGGRY